MRSGLTFLGSLTAAKIFNASAVQFSYYLSNVFSRPIVWGRPWFVSIEPASVCNLSCPQCPVGAGNISRSNKTIPLESYTKLLEEIRKTTLVLSLYFQGEPLMNKHFGKMLRMAKEKGIYTQTSTNAQLLNEKICREIVDARTGRIILSIDGTDEETYRRYRRGGSFEKAVEGLKLLREIRDRAGTHSPEIIVQFLEFRHNREHADQVREKALQWGADRVWIKSAQIEYPETADEWIPESESSRYEKSPEGYWKLKGRLRNRCRRLWQTTVITSDSLVVPCCFDKRAEYSMGKAGEMDFSGIWRSKTYKDFRKQVLTDRKAVGICTNCTEGTGRIYR